MKLRALLVIALVGAASTARADVQFGSEFVRVAKAVLRTYALEELKRVCKDTKPPSVKQLCEALIGDVGDLVVMAIDRQLDRNAFSSVLVHVFGQLTQAAVSSAAEATLSQLLDGAFSELKARDPACAADVGALGGSLSECLVALAVPGAKSPPSCKAAQDQLQQATHACGASYVPAIGNSDWQNIEGALDALVKSTNADDASLYPATVAVHQLIRTLEGLNDVGGFYDAASRITSVVDIAWSKIDNIRENSIFYDDDAKFGDDEIGRVMSAVATNNCDAAGTITTALTRWKSDKAHVFDAIAGKLARGLSPLVADLDAIPSRLPEPTCSDAAVRKAVRRLRRYAVAYRSDVLEVARLDPYVLPALTVGALVDYARTNDQKALQERIRDLTLRALARVLAAFDVDSYRCDDASDGSHTCERIGSAVTLSIPASAQLKPEIVAALVEPAYSPHAARSTCLYQAAAFLIKGDVETIRGSGGMCKQLSVADNPLAGSALGALLPSIVRSGEFELARWQGWIQLSATRAKVTLGHEFDAQLGYSAIESIFTTARHSHGQASFADSLTSLVEVVRQMAQLNTADGARALVTAGARVLEPIVNRFLDKYIAAESCSQGSGAPTLKCGVRILVGAVYEPVLAFVAVPNPTEADRQQLVRSTARRVQELDPLSRTPFLFNVGLGLTMLTRGDFSVHATLLEKIGVVKRWGDRRQYEVGAFVGGFIESIIRAATNSSDAKPYWLIGGALGVREFSKRVPLGAEIHAGAAMPYDLSHVGSDAAFAFGATLIVPVDIVLGDGRSQ